MEIKQPVNTTNEKKTHGNACNNNASAQSKKRHRTPLSLEKGDRHANNNIVPAPIAHQYADNGQTFKPQCLKEVIHFTNNKNPNHPICKRRQNPIIMNEGICSEKTAFAQRAQVDQSRRRMLIAKNTPVSMFIISLMRRTMQGGAGSWGIVQKPSGCR